jgi:hypothetical protein
MRVIDKQHAGANVLHNQRPVPRNNGYPTIGRQQSLLTLFDRFLDLSLSSLSIQDPSPAMEVRTSILRPDFYSYSRRSTGFGQALLDFSREFDITLMDSVVTALYSGSGGKEVREFILRLVPPH